MREYVGGWYLELMARLYAKIGNEEKRDKDIIIIVCYTSYPILDYSIYVSWKKKKSLPEYRRHIILLKFCFLYIEPKFVGDCVSFPQYTVLSLLYTQ